MRHTSCILMPSTTSCSHSSVRPTVRDFPVNLLNFHADEKNERSKKLIKSKFNQYLARAEVLKEHIQGKEDKRAKKLVGANWANSGTGGGGKG